MSEPAFLEKEKLKDTCRYLQSYIPKSLDFGIILGSFLNKCIGFLPLQNKVILNIADIPHMTAPSVPGHEKFILFGKLKNKKILIFPGRLHLYEGHVINDVVYPVKLLAGFNTGNLIITNSAGGLNPSFNKDDIMIIKDHLNLMFANPLFGFKYSTKYDYFLDMSCPYNEKMIDIAKKSEAEAGLDPKIGIYAGVKGPILETKTEKDALRKLGADAVGMSTVPEVIMANFLKINVLGLSHIRNMASSGKADSRSNGHKKKYRHLDGSKSEIFIGKILAKIIENILKKA
jgi:purine-nucleoside phosphorylase